MIIFTVNLSLIFRNPLRNNLKCIRPPVAIASRVSYLAASAESPIFGP